MMSDDRGSRWWLVAGGLILLGLFLLDVNLPYGVVMGPLYVLVSLFALRVSAKSAIVLASIATLANVLGYCFSPSSGIPEWLVTLNRIFAICTTWLLIVVGLHIHEQNRRMMAQLEQTNERRRLALEGADLGFWDRNLQSGTIVFDDRWLEMLGYASGDPRRHEEWYDSLMDTEDQPRVEKRWREHLLGDSDRFEVEHRLKTADGHWRDVLTKGRVTTRDSTGVALRAAGTHLDVTATRELERRAAQSLRERTEELQLVTNAIPMMISYVDAAERVQFVNSSAERMFGIACEDVCEMRLCDLVGEDMYLKFRNHVHAALRGERVQFEEIVDCAGTASWWLVHLLPRKDGTGQVLGMYQLITDISGMRQSEGEIERQREALALSNRRSAANEMAAALAHELNQPLATVSIYAGGLLEKVEGGRAEAVELAQALSLIHQESLRAGQIIRQVRELVDCKTARRAATDLRMLIDSVKRICEVRTFAARVPIQVQVDDQIESINVDAFQLQQLLVNLVNNAIEASVSQTEVSPYISIHASCDDEGTHIRVVDRGCGLSDANLKRVFEPYFTTKADGLGIGLNICQSIVAAHGGRLWASRNETVGTTFHVVLPSAPAETTLEVALSATT